MGNISYNAIYKMDILSFINLIGGSCLLYYGVELISAQLQSLSGDKFHLLLSKFTSNPVKGLLAGILVTAVVQSSTITSLVMVTLVNAGVMTFQQTISVLLGAGIGGTVIMQLIAFRVFDYAMLLIAIGLLIKFFAKTKLFRCLGDVILGFGFVFFSIQLMTLAVKPLGDNLLFKEIMSLLAKSPVSGILLSTLFTALVQNSSVTIGITIALAMQNLIDLQDAIPLIYGANIGVCVTTMISAIGDKPDAKRVAGIQTLFKCLGVLLFLPFLHPFVNLVQYTTGDLARQIANAHTLFNVIIGIVFLPFGKFFTRLGILLVPDQKGVPDPSEPKYLNENILSNPSLALGESARESLRVADIATDMYNSVIPAFSTLDENQIHDISKKDDQIDKLEYAIKIYITKLSQYTLSPEQSKRQMSILSAIANLENIGDVIDINLMELALKKISLGVHFSEPGWQDIQQLYARVKENLEMVITAYAAWDPELANKVLENKTEISQMERTLRESHIDRLKKGLKESIDTSEIHLDVLTNLKRIDSHVSAIAHAVLES